VLSLASKKSSLSLSSPASSSDSGIVMTLSWRCCTSGILFLCQEYWKVRFPLLFRRTSLHSNSVFALVWLLLYTRGALFATVDARCWNCLLFPLLVSGTGLFLLGIMYSVVSLMNGLPLVWFWRKVCSYRFSQSWLRFHLFSDILSLISVSSFYFVIREFLEMLLCHANIYFPYYPYHWLQYWF